MADAGLSQRALGKMLAKERGISAEDGRKEVGRWLKEQGLPSDESAEVLARVLGTPADHFKSRRPTVLSLQRETQALRDRLESLERRVAELADAQAQLHEDLDDVRREGGQTPQ